jgi:hypothetical protein
MRDLEISMFREARDNVPRRRLVTWADLAADLTRFTLRTDLLVDRWNEEDDIGRAIESGAWRTGTRPIERSIRAMVEKLEPKHGAEAPERARVAVIEQIRREHKARLPAWSAAAFAAGSTRAASNVEAVHLAVLDYDDGSPIDGERKRWAGFAYALHTTWRHTDRAPKYRIALPLVRPVPAALWPRVFAHLYARTGGRIDKQTKNTDRLFFLPALPHYQADRLAEVNAGAWLDLDAEVLPRTPEELAAERRANRPPPAVRWHATAAERDHARARDLRSDPDARRRAADDLGAVIAHRSGSGSCATCIPCPSCGTRSVWFPLAPSRMGGAACNHVQTCGWRGPLTDLLEKTR